jgi:putative SOS response-associated peptidase YedK
MCNLYAMTSTTDAMVRLFSVTRGTGLNTPPMPRIRPTDTVPVVRLSKNGERELVQMRWGFVLPQPGAAPKPVTNARADKVRTSSFWKTSFERRRCLVPATAFCEWTDAPPKQPHWFSVVGQSDGLFAFAGVWTTFSGRIKNEDVRLDVMAFLTTTPNALVAPIHAKSMPVILTEPQAYERWMTAAPESAHQLAAPFEADFMTVRSG